MLPAVTKYYTANCWYCFGTAACIQRNYSRYISLLCIYITYYIYSHEIYCIAITNYLFCLYFCIAAPGVFLSHLSLSLSIYSISLLYSILEWRFLICCYFFYSCKFNILHFFFINLFVLSKSLAYISSMYNLYIEVNLF